MLFENSGEKSTKHQDNVKLDTLYLKDPGTWPDVIKDTVRQSIVSCAYKYEEFVSKTFPKDGTLKPFSDYLLSSKSINNRESYPRIGWFGALQEKHFTVFHVFCSKKTFLHLFNLAKRERFTPSKTQWKKLYNRLPAHENSAEHRNGYCKRKSLQQTLLCKGIDSELQKQIACEADKWKAILRRLLDVTLFSASRNLPFQGDST
ncbi:hypothetical protein PR048_028821 [Dryococelus australis]|uniref:Uncharacterized protein n=1 Tax=Dryococelus australis TaxID=614101 RepID=A0ABQ9GBM8_9NEOP|nr:hypothetical protein PR048_028821 [Dryococelus australis]